MKKGAIEMETLVKIILGLAFLVFFIGLIVVITSTDSGALSKFSCWLSNGLKSSNKLFQKQLPTTCMLFEPEEPAGMEEIAKMLTDTWWMFGKGGWDLGWTDNERAVFWFTSKENTNFTGIINYLLLHNEGRSVTEIADSDYNYLQKGSEKQTLCYGAKILEDNIPKLKAGTKYFIVFFDDSGLEERGDKVVITAKPQLKQEENYFCKSIVERSTIKISAGEPPSISEYIA